VTWEKEDGKWKLHRDIWNTQAILHRSIENGDIGFAMQTRIRGAIDFIGH
jgi:hypothetical protein